jgi:hypothetical protein
LEPFTLVVAAVVYTILRHILPEGRVAAVLVAEITLVLPLLQAQRTEVVAEEVMQERLAAVVAETPGARAAPVS